jgi:hypothetical protein
VWRHLNPELEGYYSYYSYKFQCRSKGIGWRLDFFVVRCGPFFSPSFVLTLLCVVQVSERILSAVKYCEMRQEICASPSSPSALPSCSPIFHPTGGASDHIPLVLDIDASTLGASVAGAAKKDEEETKKEDGAVEETKEEGKDATEKKEEAKEE